MNCFALYYGILMRKEGNKLYVLDFCRETLRNVLLSVYGNKEHVDEDLVEVIKFFRFAYVDRVEI